MEFDLQKFLSEMQSENRANNLILNRTVENGFAEVRNRTEIISANLAIHEKSDISIQAEIDSRLLVIENVAKSAKWFFRAGIIAVITFILDFIRFHSGILK